MGRNKCQGQRYMIHWLEIFYPAVVCQSVGAEDKQGNDPIPRIPDAPALDSGREGVNAETRGRALAYNRSGSVSLRLHRGIPPRGMSDRS